MTPLQRAMRFHSSGFVRGRWPTLGRIIIFILLQFFALFVIFWAGLFTLVAAIWRADPNYIWIFLLLVGGFELLALRIVVRYSIVTVLGIALLACGIWLHHADSAAYNVRTCHFIQHSTCQPFVDGFLCRQESRGFINERTITRDDISACAALDEF